MDKIVQVFINIVFGASIIAGGYVLGLALEDFKEWAWGLVIWLNS